MAVLDGSDLKRLRNWLALDNQGGDWDKTDINAAFQAVEDWIDKAAVRQSVSDGSVIASLRGNNDGD
jgi:hypothetical protein